MNKLKYLIAVMGGFQYGYTIAVMAGALLFIAPIYHLDRSQQGFLVSAILIGALLGSALGGKLADLLGRKKAQMAIAATFLGGVCFVVFAPSLLTLILGRIVQGLACGAISVNGPMYIAEVSSPSRRGTWVSFYQLSVTFGILCAYLMSFLFSSEGAWKWMFALGAIPALVHGIGFYFLPDFCPPLAEKEPASWKNVFSPSNRSSLYTALMLNILQQLIGINVVIYFAPTIFEHCGVASSGTAIFSAVLIGIVNFITTILATFLVDRKGRRPLLLIGAGGMVISLIALSISCLSGISSLWLSTGSLMLYIASFAISMGPICQLMTSELFCHSIRSRGVALSTFTGWIFNFLVVFSFMGLSSFLTQGGVFLLYAFFGLLSILFIWKRVPETNGSALS